VPGAVDVIIVYWDLQVIFPSAAATHRESVAGTHPAGKAKAAIRAEVLSWGLDDQYVDPEDTLLRLIAQSSTRAPTRTTRSMP
jgi:hypothetical protein